MANINLLPWREELRAQMKTEFIAIMGIAAALAVVVIVIIHVYNVKRIDYQKSRNVFLDKEIVLLDEQLKEIAELKDKKQQLIDRMDAIEKLQSIRPIIVHLFDEMVSTLPNGVYITSLAQKGTSITIDGVARSNARVSNFMRNIECSQWVEKATLNVIENSKDAKGKRLKRFVLKFQQTMPKPKGEGEGEDEDAAAAEAEKQSVRSAKCKGGSIS